jgi:hypothetical protein
VYARLDSVRMRSDGGRRCTAVCSSEHTPSSASASATVAASASAPASASAGGSRSAWLTTACSISALPRCTSCAASTAGAALSSAHSIAAAATRRNTRECAPGLLQ